MCIIEDKCHRLDRLVEHYYILSIIGLRLANPDEKYAGSVGHIGYRRLRYPKS
jgi:hypothetical protein